MSIQMIYIQVIEQQVDQIVYVFQHTYYTRSLLFFVCLITPHICSIFRVVCLYVWFCIMSCMVWYVS